MSLATGDTVVFIQEVDPHLYEPRSLIGARGRIEYVDNVAAIVRLNLAFDRGDGRPPAREWWAPIHALERIPKERDRPLGTARTIGEFFAKTTRTAS